MGREIDLFTNMTATDKLIVYCTRESASLGERVSLTKLLEEPINWSDLLRQSAWHGVTSYVHQYLKKVNSNLVPEEVPQKLKHTYLKGFSRAVALSQELSKILQELEKRKIKNILLKGPFLAEKIYRRSEMRSYGDIDILVQKSDLSKAKEVLINFGYSLLDKNWKLFQEEGKTQFHFQKDNSFLVDLHWEPLDNKWYPSLSKYFQENVWENACLIKLNNSTTWALPPVDLLIYQCVHLSVHHNFQRLIWFKDVDQVLRSSDINWKLFFDKVKKYRLATYCYYALYFTQTLLGSPVPESVLSELRPKFLTARAFEFFLKRENLLRFYENRRGRAQQMWMILRDNLAERIKALRWRTFPSIEWYLHYYSFLPRLKNIYYYPFYPLLVLLRLLRPPVT